MCIMIDYKKKTLVNSKTQDKVKPACFDDLVQYHAYLISSKHPKQAQDKLRAVFDGEKVMTELVKRASGETH